MSFFEKMQNIDRRILYLILAVVIIVPLWKKPSQHPAVILDEVKNAYRTIDNVPKDKIVLVSTIWSAGTKAENEPQTEAVMRHMFSKGIKFVVVSWDPAGTELSYNVGARLEKELNKKYGIDWAHLGFRVPQLQQVIKGLSQDFKKQFGQDKQGTPLSEVPVTKNVHDHKQIGAVIEITPSGTLDTWIAYLTMPKHIPLVFCPTAVMSVEAYPYIDSGQVAGMLNGVMGAVQYETLIGLGDKATPATATAWALSSAIIFIIALIIIGNTGYVLAKRAKDREQGGTRIG